MKLFAKKKLETETTDTSPVLDWEASRSESLEKSEARAWWVARSFGAMGLLCVVALVVMVPFYRIVPVFYQVDQLTGDAQVVSASTVNVPQKQSMDKHWVTRYVQVRERYIWNLLDMDFQTVLTMSDDKVALAYKAQFEGSNALDKKLGPGTEMSIEVGTVSLPPGQSGSAVVRFKRTIRKNGSISEIGRYAATLSFEYKPATLAVRERQLIDNPFGFKVTGYVVDTEMTNESEQKPAAAANQQ